jgi:hypothetical protein
MKIKEKTPHVSNQGYKKRLFSGLRGYRRLRQDNSENFEANFNKLEKENILNSYENTD